MSWSSSLWLMTTIFFLCLLIIISIIIIFMIVFTIVFIIISIFLLLLLLLSLLLLLLLLSLLLLLIIIIITIIDISYRCGVHRIGQWDTAFKFHVRKCWVTKCRSFGWIRSLRPRDLGSVLSYFWWRYVRPSTWQIH